MSADLDGKNKVDEKTDLTVFMEPEEGPNVLQNPW